jgi:hypothetical protein
MTNPQVGVGVSSWTDGCGRGGGACVLVGERGECRAKLVAGEDRLLVHGGG